MPSPQPSPTGRGRKSGTFKTERLVLSPSLFGGRVWDGGSSYSDGFGMRGIAVGFIPNVTLSFRNESSSEESVPRVKSIYAKNSLLFP